MIAEIITIGGEITDGSTLNTNSCFLSKKLFELGFETYYHSSVDDNPKRLSAVISIALARADIIITTGGLGPTEDDITKEVVLDVLDLQDNELYLLKNRIGTAPGVFIEYNDNQIIMLPGPPNEMKPMFKQAIPLLRKQDNFIIKKSINTFGIREALLEKELLKMELNQKNINIKIFPKDASVEIRVMGKDRNKNSIENQIHKAIKKIEENLKEYIYGHDNITIEEVVIKLLKRKKLKLGLCESCTGGLISSKIVSVAGASQVLDRSIVSYSNEAKMEELNVSIKTLHDYGAVSKETAYEMAKGLIEKTDRLDIVLSITGIAGPDGGSVEKPVGLVYICVMTRDYHHVIKANFSGNREMIQERAAMKALNEIRKVLLN